MVLRLCLLMFSLALLAGAAAHADTDPLTRVGILPKASSAGPTKSPTEHKAVVLFFMGQECPISNTYSPEIERIVKAYTPRKVAFYLIYPDSDLKIADARKHAKAYSLTAPILLDPKHDLVRRVGVTVTPEVAVYTPDGTLRYRGRIDNLYAGLGQKRGAATEHDLRDALDSLLQQRPVPHARTTPIGCFIPLSTKLPK